MLIGETALVGRAFIDKVFLMLPSLSTSQVLLAVGLALLFAVVQFALGFAVGFRARDWKWARRWQHRMAAHAKFRATARTRSRKNSAANNPADESAPSSAAHSQHGDAIAANVDSTTAWMKRLKRAESRLQAQTLEIAAHREAARTDLLTGITNRRGFEDELVRRRAAAVRSGQPLCMILFDVDHFKSLNDVYGHPTGDYVLRTLAHAIHAAIRPEDTIARYGGEEFALLLSQTSLQDATAVAERIRAAVQNCNFSFEGLSPRVTVSLGVSQFVSNEESAKFVRRADVALYAAKTMGRNQVVCQSAESDTDAVIADTSDLKQESSPQAVHADPSPAMHSEIPSSATDAEENSPSQQPSFTPAVVEDPATRTLVADLRDRLSQVAGFAGSSENSAALDSQSPTSI